MATAYVSTDGHKLCLVETDKAAGVSEVLGITIAEHAGVILPSADVKELARWASFDPNVPAQFIDAQMSAILEIDGLAAASAEAEQVTAQRISPQHFLHQQR